MKTVIDLFSGCGGLSKGFEQAGFKTVFANDINPTCANTFKKNIDIEENCFFTGDINDIIRNYSKYSSLFKGVDVICGGPPCQGFSMANRQRIIDDPRNVLYKSFLKILHKAKPKIFIMENVRGMYKKIDEILDDFNRMLGSSYNISCELINAKDYGVPQNRERLFIIGNNIERDSNYIFKQVLKKKRNSYTLKEAISDLPPLGVNTNKNNTAIENEIVGFYKTEHKYSIDNYYKFINGNRVMNYIYNHKNRYNNERDAEIFVRLPQGGNSLHSSISDIMPYKSRNHIFKDKYFKLKYDDICKTITAHMKFDCNMYIHPTQPRGLSPREAARVQTFPDDFIFTGPQNSWYMQIGNAVPVKLASIIGNEVIKCL